MASKQMSIIFYPKKDDKIHTLTREYLPISALNQKLLDKISTYSLVNDWYMFCHAAQKNS